LLLDVLSGLVKLPHVKEDGIRLQRAIAEAIEKHDPQKARQATIEHMASVIHTLDTLE